MWQRVVPVLKIFSAALTEICETTIILGRIRKNVICQFTQNWRQRVESRKKKL